MSTKVVFASSILDALLNKIFSDTTEKPLLVDEEEGALSDFLIFLNQLTVLGGAPNIGKSSLLGKIVSNFLRKNPDRIAFLADVEMLPEEIFRRMISGMTGVDLSMNRASPLTGEEMKRIGDWTPTIKDIADRLMLMPPPITLVDVAETINQYNPTLIGLDYLQRVDIGNGIAEANERMNTSRKMSLLREFTPGRHIIAVTALSRSAGQNGNSYKASNLGMASSGNPAKLNILATPRIYS